MNAWGDGDEDFAYPLNQYCESQLADEYEIPIAGSAEGSLVFEVPSDQKDFALGFEEYYEDESVGDLYVVYFRSVYKELHTNHCTGLLTTNKG